MLTHVLFAVHNIYTFHQSLSFSCEVLSSCISSFFHYLTQEQSVSLYAGFTWLDFVPIVE